MVRGLVEPENCFGANVMRERYLLLAGSCERKTGPLPASRAESQHKINKNNLTTTCTYQSYSQSLPYNKDWKKYLSARVRAAALVGSNVLIFLFYFVDLSFPNYLNQCGAYVIDH